MTDNELLLAIADIMDRKIKPVKEDVAEMKIELRATNEKVDALACEIAMVKVNLDKTNLHIENVTDRNIQLLAENYVPAAQRYEAAASEIDTLKVDVDVMKKVIKEHSERLQLLA